MLDIDKAWKASQKAALLGREVLLDYFGHLTQVTEKNQAGLVSEADKESEKVISEYLRSQFPDISILGEEESFDNPAERPEGGYAKSGVWLIDPLDGTTNYVHKVPIYCVSIGLQYNGEMQVGVVDVPGLKKTYAAAKGRGAFLDGVPLHVSQRKTLDESLLATGFSTYDEDSLKEQIEIFSSFIGKSRGIRRVGSAAYDMCLVAEGVFDAYWEKNLSPWDTAAGTLLVQEAGGVVTTYDGKKYSPFDRTVVCGNSEVHSIVQKRIYSMTKNHR